ncbi:MAG: hypothetical protein JSW52_06700 [Candidatus Coatesbacteria bacterium]|nr:MAG: hypothetical protein JSW52_06700 [Candidatus Coatesbacteria bacterium]
MRKCAISFPLTVLIVSVLTPSYTVAGAWEDGEVPEDYVGAELAKKAALYVYYTDVCEDRSTIDPNIKPRIIGEPIELYCFGGSTKPRPKYIVTLYIGEGDISSEDLDKAAMEELKLAKPYLTLGPGRKWSDGSSREVGWETLDNAYYGSVGDRYDLWTIVVKGSKYAGINEGPGPGVHPVLRSRSKLEYIAKRYLGVEGIIGGRYFTSKGFTCGREFITEDGKKVYVQEDLDGHHDSYIHTEDDPFPVYELSESEAPPYNEGYFELWEEVEGSDYEPDSFMSD